MRSGPSAHKGFVAHPRARTGPAQLRGPSAYQGQDRSSSAERPSIRFEVRRGQGSTTQTSSGLPQGSGARAVAPPCRASPGQACGSPRDQKCCAFVGRAEVNTSRFRLTARCKFRCALVLASSGLPKFVWVAKVFGRRAQVRVGPHLCLRRCFQMTQVNHLSHFCHRWLFTGTGCVRSLSKSENRCWLLQRMRQAKVSLKGQVQAQVRAYPVLFGVPLETKEQVRSAGTAFTDPGARSRSARGERSGPCSGPCLGPCSLTTRSQHKTGEEHAAQFA